MTEPEYLDPHIAEAVCSAAEMEIVRYRNQTPPVSWAQIARATGRSRESVRSRYASAHLKIRRAQGLNSDGSERNVNAASYVYFIKAGDHIKIGYATDVVARLRDLQVGNQHELVLLGSIPGTPDDERRIHQRFARYHERGEWFRDCRDIRLFVHYEQARTRKVGSADG